MLYAHEFWIEPLKYINENNEIKAHLRVGQNFEGMTLMYNTSDFTKFNILSGSKNKKINIKGILGDIPALNLKSSMDNLVILYHETNDKFVDYKKFSKFEDFVSEKGHTQLIDQHIELNYPKENFVESYRRYAKSLIVINGTSGRDKKTGLLFESNNARSLSKKILKALSMDEASLQSIGKEGRKNIIQKFNVEKMCFSTYSEYKRILN